MEKLILVVDDETKLADTLVAILRISGYAATAVYGSEDALEVVRQREPALVISDVIMAGVSGVQLAKQIHERHPNVRIMLMSGNTETTELIEEAYAQGFGFELLAKPVPPKQMLERVAAILRDEGCAISQAAG